MAKPDPIDVSVTRRIDADPDTVYDLVADITRMPEWSPENTATQWLKGHDIAEVGARFQGTNELGSMSWKTKPTITVADRGRAFAFSVPGPSRATWRYDFKRDGDQTVVTESVLQNKPSPLPIRFMQRRAGVVDRAASLRSGMATTLDRLAVVAETAARVSGDRTTY